MVVAALGFLGLLLGLFILILAMPEMWTVQTTGTALSGTVSSFYARATPIAIIVSVLVVGGGLFYAAATAFLRLR